MTAIGHNSAAAITGSYADLKIVKTRSVCQIVIEIPIEQGARAVEIFGFPQPGAEVPVAVARLVEQPKGACMTQAPSDKPKERRPFHERPRSQQAAILCQDVAFQQWLGVRGRPETIVDDTARHLRERLRIQSRRELDADEGAGADFDALRLQFEQATGRMAQDRG